jgi:hypothetical protein
MQRRKAGQNFEFKGLHLLHLRTLSLSFRKSSTCSAGRRKTVIEGTEVVIIAVLADRGVMD